MKNIIIPTIVFLISTDTVFTQLYNAGLISIVEEGLIYVDGDYKNVAEGQLSLKGELYIWSDWRNDNPDLFDDLSFGNVYFLGGNSTLSGQEIVFPNLEISKTGTLQLNTPISVEDHLILGEGALDLNGHLLTLESDNADAILVDNGYLFNASDLGGVEQFPGALESPYIYPFAAADGTDASVAIAFEGFPLVPIRVNTYATDVDNNPLPSGVNEFLFGGQELGQKSVDRFWLIETIDGEGTAELKFTEGESEGNSVTLENLSLLHFEDGAWVKVDSMGYDEGTDAYRMDLGMSGAFALSDLGTTTAVRDLVAVSGNMSIAPNPTADWALLSFINQEYKWDKVVIFNALGQVLRNYAYYWTLGLK